MQIIVLDVSLKVSPQAHSKRDECHFACSIRNFSNLVCIVCTIKKLYYLKLPHSVFPWLQLQPDMKYEFYLN